MSFDPPHSHPVCLITADFTPPRVTTLTPEIHSDTRCCSRISNRALTGFHSAKRIGHTKIVTALLWQRNSRFNLHLQITLRYCLHLSRTKFKFFSMKEICQRCHRPIQGDFYGWNSYTCICGPCLVHELARERFNDERETTQTKPKKTRSK